MIDVAVIGGGAAGFFAALTAKERNPSARVVILEKTAVLLSKVRVSGGGRCNVTHACFSPKELVLSYPRGHKELLGPFHLFAPKDTIAWFESRGVAIKAEEDGRCFPVSDSSETIIRALVDEAKKLGVIIELRQNIEKIEQTLDGFTLFVKGREQVHAKKVILATGSSSAGFAFAESLGHTIEPPVPSLFTFNIPDFALKDLSGISFAKAGVSIRGTSFSYEGPLLITHFGLSGPAVLKLSAFAARYLHEKNYTVEIAVRWIPDLSLEQIQEALLALKKRLPAASLISENPFHLPKNFWKTFVHDTKRLNDFSVKELTSLATRLFADVYLMNGKTTHKEEFVTCGGVSLKEVSFKTMESKKCPGLFFAGEILDIDGITGGFNFQNAWTTGFIAGTSL